jgi:hypothetical protein
MTTADQASALPTSRKVLCLVYGVIAVAALFATWSQNLAYFDDSKVTPASRSISVDALLLAISAATLMVIAARRHGVKYVWLYIAGAFVTAISVVFPLFLIARELRMGTSDAPRLSATDKFLLAVVVVVTAGWAIWVDVG